MPSGPGEVGRLEESAQDSSRRVNGALYHGVEEWVKEGGSFWEEFTASGLSVATEPREAKSVARRLETAIGSDTKLSPERKTIAVGEEGWLLRSLTFFHTTEDGVSAVIDEINADQLSFFAVSTVWRKTALSLL